MIGAAALVLVLAVATFLLMRDDDSGGSLTDSGAADNQSTVTDPVTDTGTGNRNAGTSLSANGLTQFRSDYGNSSERGLPTEWNSSDNLAWKTPLPGFGASSPIVAGDRIYVTCYSGYGLSEQSPGRKGDLVRHLVCVNRSDGSIIFDTKTPAIRETQDYRGFIALHGFTSSTPVTDGQRVYCFYGNSGVYAFDATTGNEEWQADAGGNTHGFGTGSSPVLHANMVLVNASVESGHLIAFDRSNGQEVWRAPGVEDAWGSPVVVGSGDRTEIVVDTKSRLNAFDANSGQNLWTCAGSQPPRYICPTPICVDGIIYAMHGLHGPLTAVRPGGTGDVTSSHRLWTISRFASNVTSPVVSNGLLFGIKEEGGVAMVADIEAGTMLNQKRIQPGPGRIYASPLAADGKIFVVSRSNGIYVLSADRDLNVLAHNTLDDDRSIFNATPVAHNGQLLLRSDRFLYCIGK